ncbi:MAG: hypothetical protein IJT27_09160 [Clostridia bacterium]|nr:hypothetical protein [Clostridia bacterium]
MYDKVITDAKPLRDRLLVIILLIAVLLVAAATPPMYLALNASFRYHQFVQAFSKDLVFARHNGVILLSEDGRETQISPDAVSRLLVRLTDCGLGQPKKQTPNVQHLEIRLPNGSALTVFDTPEPNEEGFLCGVTVCYSPAKGKAFTYLQRLFSYSEAYSLLHNGGS